MKAEWEQEMILLHRLMLNSVRHVVQLAYSFTASESDE